MTQHSVPVYVMEDPLNGQTHGQLMCLGFCLLDLEQGQTTYNAQHEEWSASRETTTVFHDTFDVHWLGCKPGVRLRKDQTTQGLPYFIPR